MDMNFANTQPPFDRSEYALRISQVRKRMMEEDIEILLLSDPCNIYYLTGYDGWSFYTMQFLLVALEGDPVWVGREMDTLGVRMLAWMSDDSIVDYSDKLVQQTGNTKVIGHSVDILADYINQKYPGVRKIGVEKNSYYLTVESYELLKQALKRPSLDDASLLVNWIRFVKSPNEIRVMKQAAQLLDLSMQSAVSTAEPGVRECDVAAAAYVANIAGSEDFGGVYTSSPAFVTSGERTATPHLCWSDRRIESDTTMNLELMGNRFRYQVTMARTVCFGKASRQLRDLEAVVLEGIDQVLDFIKPGVSCEEVELVWRKCIAKYGIVKESRCGYSLGIAYPPTGGELTASFRPGDTTILHPNVVMHFLPAIWSSSQSLTIGEPIRVTSQGCERLSKFPRELIVKHNGYGKKYELTRKS